MDNQAIANQAMVHRPTNPPAMQETSVQRLTAKGFARFGSVARPPSTAPLARTDAFAYWSDAVHYAIDGETEIGYCTVFRPASPEVTWFERHDRTPEILIPIDAPFVLPVMDEGGKVEAFQVNLGEAAVLAPGVWHSACLPVDADASSYFVLFRRGTPAEDVIKRDVAPVRLTHS